VQVYALAGKVALVTEARPHRHQTSHDALPAKERVEGDMHTG
jgi:hypothetical protein